MKTGSIRIARNSMVVLAIQLAIVSSVAAKYLYERWTSPRVWTRAEGFDPELMMRGRYLSLRLFVDGCGSTLPTAKAAQFPRNVDGTVRSPRYTVMANGALEFPAEITVQHDRLTAMKQPDSARAADGLKVLAEPGSSCDAMRLAEPVSFYLPEHAASPLPLKQGTELWMQVTVPPKGPPRPIGLGIKQGGILNPLAFN